MQGIREVCSGSTLAMPKGNLLSNTEASVAGLLKPFKKRGELPLLTRRTSLLPNLVEAPVLTHGPGTLSKSSVSVAHQRQNTPLINHPQWVKSYFFHFVGEKFLFLISHHYGIFLQFSPRCSLVVRRLRTFPKVKYLVIYLFNNSFLTILQFFPLHHCL